MTVVEVEQLINFIRPFLLQTDSAELLLTMRLSRFENNEDLPVGCLPSFASFP